MQKDESGEPFFKTLKAGRVCDDCSRLPYEQMMQCNHVEDGAHWKNPHKLKRLKVLFEGDEARGLRELAGEIASDFTACFQKPDIDRLFNNPIHYAKNMPECIYFSIDPNGGGPSKIGGVSGFFDGNDLVVSTLTGVVVVVVVVDVKCSGCCFIVGAAAAAATTFIAPRKNR